MISRVLEALDRNVAACPALPVVDSLRLGADFVTGEAPRDGLWRAQTPQGFRFAEILAAHAAAAPGATDDAEIARAAGHAVRLVAGDERAMKLTFADDFARAEAMLQTIFVTGTGFDVHRFGPGDHVWLAGVKLPFSHGLVGHSDADVALHALTDAVLGALGDGDIGMHFPPSDMRWKGVSSDRFLAHAASLVAATGGRIVHVDVTIIAEAPKVGPHRPAMVARIAEILADHAPRVSVKATTTEGLGFTGRREGLAAQAAATISLPDWDRLQDRNVP
jgi:2-C-methyl-D-erythritol 4-phosphate cytidylyltransferase/2-C-methyl-D-erythritol 2,4-cyclodiphosphate synthase